MSDDKVRYVVKISSESDEYRLVAEFRAVPEDILNQHPIDVFGPTFTASLQEAALAFVDPNVREVPIYCAGEMEPIAYLKREGA